MFEIESVRYHFPYHRAGWEDIQKYRLFFTSNPFPGLISTCVDGKVHCFVSVIATGLHRRGAMQQTCLVSLYVWLTRRLIKS